MAEPETQFTVYLEDGTELSGSEKEIRLEAHGVEYTETHTDTRTWEMRVIPWHRVSAVQKTTVMPNLPPPNGVLVNPSVEDQ
jgi:hypothetical protein